MKPKPVWILGVAALVGCVGSPPPADVTSQPVPAQGIGDAGAASANDGSPEDSATIDASRAPTDASAAVAEPKFHSIGRCTSVTAEGADGEVDWVGHVADFVGQSPWVRVTLSTGDGGASRTLIFSCESGSRPPLDRGQRVRARLRCSRSGFGGGCYGTLYDSSGAALMLTSEVDASRLGWSISDGAIVAVRPYAAGRGKETRRSLVVRFAGTRVSTQPDSWVSLATEDGNWLVFGWSSRWSGMAPHDAEDFRRFAAVRESPTAR